MLPFVMVAAYTTIYLILPYYLKKRNLILAVFLEVVLIFTITLGERILLRTLNDYPVTLESLFGITFVYLMLETNFMVAIAFAIKFGKKWFEQQNEKHNMEKQNLTAELNLLRAQLHPHFLFNTLNNLYALSLEESTKTSEGIARISELLGSVLYECNEVEISLKKEIKLIRNYIDLEKLRYDNHLNISFNVAGNMEDIKIAPMILFTFVENCFKHGYKNDSAVPSIIIELQIKEKHIHFMARNSKSKQKTTDKVKESGIGLSNVKKRLDLIYGDNYDLDIKDFGDLFEINLVIREK